MKVEEVVVSQSLEGRSHFNCSLFEARLLLVFGGVARDHQPAVPVQCTAFGASRCIPICISRCIPEIHILRKGFSFDTTSKCIAKGLHETLRADLSLKELLAST